MLYEHKFDCLTRGMVNGKAIIETLYPAQITSVIAPRSFKPLVKRELHVAENFTKAPDIDGAVRAWKILIRSRETKEIIWVRPFANQHEAILLWERLLQIDVERVRTKNCPVAYPTTHIDGDFEYCFCIVDQFTEVGSGVWQPYEITEPNFDINLVLEAATETATSGTGSFSITGATVVDYLVVAGGGSGGSTSTGSGYEGAGGGGAGGMLYTTNYTYSAKTYTVGAGGTAPAANSHSPGNNGSNSTFDGNSTVGGGGGASNTAQTGKTGGSGGGGDNSQAGGGTSGSGLVNNGGAGSASAGGGGGGSGGTGFAASGTTGGNGGLATANSITGSSVRYAGGAGGGGRASNAQGLGDNNTASHTAGDGGSLNNVVTPTSGGTNKGDGGGGSGGTTGASNDLAGGGGSGFVAISYTPSLVIIGNMPMLGM